MKRFKKEAVSVGCVRLRTFISEAQCSEGDFEIVICMPIWKELSLNQKNKGAVIHAIEKPLFVVQGCLEMNLTKQGVKHQLCQKNICITINKLHKKN